MEVSMAEGTSGYLKNKKTTLKELDKATASPGKKSVPMEEENPVDEAIKTMDRDNEEAKGITQRIRNIFGS
jgi:hypothetical protein